ncbi:MAG: TIGR01777 family oxidoreductase [Bacteroidales bacterium]
MKKILVIAGGTGFIGSHIINACKDIYTIRILSRSHTHKINGCETFLWHPETETYDSRAFEGAHCIINLSGENISHKRWTHTQKNNILMSRIQSLQTLYKATQETSNSINHIISSSATGIYGHKKSHAIYTEQSPTGDDFLSHVCIEWEKYARRFNNIGVHSTIIRTGVVLDAHNGAFPHMIQTLPLKMLAIPGNGKQYVPWIHITDITNMYIYCLHNNLYGTFNAVADDSTQYCDIIQSIKKIKNFFSFTIPSFFLSVILGEMHIIITKGNKISNSKIISHGYTFTYSSISKTIKNLLT